MQLFWGKDHWLKGAAFYLRYMVFVLEQGITPQDEFDENDENRLYGVCMKDSHPAGTIRFMADSKIQLHPDRLCVHPDCRGQGIGRKLLLGLEAIGISQGMTQSVLDAEVEAIAFYEGLGYQVISEPYLEDGVPCVKMKKML